MASHSRAGQPKLGETEVDNHNSKQSVDTYVAILVALGLTMLLGACSTPELGQLGDHITRACHGVDCKGVLNQLLQFVTR